MRINWDGAWSADFDAHLVQKLGGELVAIGQFERSPVHLELVANVEVVDRVEGVVVRWRQGNTVTSDQGS